MIYRKWNYLLWTEFYGGRDHYEKILLGILAAILLLISFPVRSYYGTMASDIIRLIGFILLIVFTALKYIGLKNKWISDVWEGMQTGRKIYGSILDNNLGIGDIYSYDYTDLIRSGTF